MDRQRDTGPEEETYWQERGDGKFVLRVAGIERAIAHTHNNTGVMLTAPNAPAYRFTAPDSQTIFDAIEQRAGIGRVEEFRNQHGTRTIIPWRDMAERNAQYFRSQHPPEREAQHYARQAWHLLNEKST